MMIGQGHSNLEKENKMLRGIVIKSVIFLVVVAIAFTAFSYWFTVPSGLESQTRAVRQFDDSSSSWTSMQQWEFTKNGMSLVSITMCLLIFGLLLFSSELYAVCRWLRNKLTEDGKAPQC